MAPEPALADPTDFGNQPGDGPLRAGGRSVSSATDPTLARTQQNNPATRSPRSAAQMPDLTVCRDLWKGRSQIVGKGEEYLPRAPGEDHTSYRNRLNRSAFFNAFRRTIEGLSGLVFRRDPTLSDDVPAPIVADWENIDMMGTHGDVFCRELLEDDLQAGHAAILVEYPNTGGDQTAADELVAIRPYWVHIKKEDILSWRTKNVGGSVVLTQVVLRETSYDEVGAFGEQLTARYRVIERSDDTGTKQPVTYRVYEISKDNVPVEIETGFYGNQIEIPLAEIKSSGRESIFCSTPPLIDLAWLNVAHYQMWSDYMWSIHKTNVPFLFAAGITEAIDEAGNAVPLTVGANTYISTSDPNGSMQYVSHNGAALGSSKAALDDLKADMGALGLAMLMPQTRVAETALARRLDRDASDSALAVTARGVQDGIERALTFHARYRQIDGGGGSVEINRDFEGLLLEAPVMQAFAALVREGFPPRVVLESLQRGGRLPDDADLDALEFEWLAGMAGADSVEPESA